MNHVRDIESVSQDHPCDDGYQRSTPCTLGYKDIEHEQQRTDQTADHTTPADHLARTGRRRRKEVAQHQIVISELSTDDKKKNRKKSEPDAAHDG